ncbi:MAG: PAS domain-containing protein [Candidatus Electryonea clarkiae]|nr:PAS domain-containing protein [Candidatus Electryonea clarkiae]MDP8285584.1 PAS domain-containing protein [Candidatus Electryonea clarkiae]
MVNQQESPNIAPEGHPIHTLMEEHRILLEFAAKLVESAKELKEYNSIAEASDQVSGIVVILDHFKDAQKHYLREENVLFPYLEKQGISGPTAQMWDEHEQIRGVEKEIFKLMDNHLEMEISEIARILESHARNLNGLLSVHYQKENLILFTMAMRSFTENDWDETEKQFAEIGYCGFSPASAKRVVSDAESGLDENMLDGNINTGSGELTREELTAMLNSLPVELTFVDKDDTFRYFNQVKDSIFTRTVAAIGTKVQNCHPRKSVHIVNKIIEDFKSGTKDEVSFWIHMKEKYVYIRYFAVRNTNGEYLGVMEVSQDIKNIQEISGEKRLME